MGGSTVKPLTVSAPQDRALVMLAHSQVDSAGGSRDQRDDRGLGALAGDPQGPVTPLDPEVLDVRRAGFADSQTIETEQDGEGCVLAVELLGGEEEHSELGAVEASGVGGMDLGSAHVLGWVRGDPAVDVSEAVEAADRRQAAVDR
jgi:hypothetical protein